MIILQDKKKSKPSDCNYLPDKMWCFNYFFATGLDEYELEELLSTGWRKFGYYFFKPQCGDCKQCLPIRVKVKEFSPTKSQRRIINKNKDIRVEFKPLKFSEKIFQLYKDHSLNRFGKVENSKEDFIASFFTKSCPTLQSMYYLDKKLIGVGFIDVTHKALSSIYYVFDTKFSYLNLGTFSILKEISHAAALGLSDYYLGYYINGCSSMAYKNRFSPYEIYDWDNKKWLPGK